MRLLEAWAEHVGTMLEGYSSWTLENARDERGAEADECYTVGRIASGDEDRPDLAVEVIWISGGINKLDVYRKLGVNEVWFYERGSLQFFKLHADAGEERYVRNPDERAFATIASGSVPRLHGGVRPSSCTSHVESWARSGAGG